jgi:hypothetical protein
MVPPDEPPRAESSRNTDDADDFDDDATLDFGDDE